jgi:acyl-CoA-binding protein
VAALEQESTFDSDKSIAELMLDMSETEKDSKASTAAGSNLPRTPVRSVAPENHRSLGRSVFGDFSALSMVFASYQAPTTFLAVEIHSSSQPYIIPRHYPDLPLGVGPNIFDHFSLPARSPTLDVAVLLTMLAKAVAEDVLSPSAPAAGQDPSVVGASKRAAQVFQRDTALHLLSHVFSTAGAAFAASPLLVACVSRFVAPSILSHTMSPRITFPVLSICAKSSDLQQGQNLTKFALPPTTVFRAVLQAIGSIWAARGSDEGTSSSAADESSQDPSASPLDADGTSGYVMPHVPANIREACAREVGAMIRSVVLHTLASNAAPPSLRLEVIEELSSWIAAPQHLMELFINHDMYPSAACPFPHMRLLRSIVATLVNISGMKMRAYLAPDADGEPPIYLTAEGDSVMHPDSLPVTATSIQKSATWEAWNRQELRLASATLLCSIVRGLMDSAATVHLAAGVEELDSRTGAGCTNAAGAVGVTSDVFASTTAHPGAKAGGALRIVPPTPGLSRVGSAAARAASAGMSNSPSSAGGSSSARGAFSLSAAFSPMGSPGLSRAPLLSVRVTHNKQDELEISYSKSLPIFKEKGVRKGLQGLFDHGYLERVGGDVAAFLRLCGSELTTMDEIGDYLGDEGRSNEEKDLACITRSEFFGSLNFVNMPFDLAMRYMLVKANFRLPGEAQKIERINAAFALAFYEDNKPSPEVYHNLLHDYLEKSSGDGDSKKPRIPPSIATHDGRIQPTSVDVIEILAFSCIMLNTDAHNPNVKKEKKMTCKQFISNVRGVDSGHDLPVPFLETMYDAIIRSEIKMDRAPITPVPIAAPASAAMPLETDDIPLAGPPGTTAVLSPNLGSSSPLPGTIVADVEGDSLADEAAYVKYLGESSVRWTNYLNACTKADDRRGTALLGPASLFLVDAHGEAPAQLPPPVAEPTEKKSKKKEVKPPVKPLSEIPVSGCFVPIPYRRNFSITTVACAILDLWPHIMRSIQTLLGVTTDSLTPLTRIQAAQPKPIQSTSSKRLSLFSLGSLSSTADKANVSVRLPQSGKADIIPASSFATGSPSEIDLRLSAIDTLKYAISACLFIGLGVHVLQGANALLQVEAAVLGQDSARASQVNPDGWYYIISSFATRRSSSDVGGVDPSAVASTISAVHIAVAEMREAATAQSDTAAVQSTAARFKGVVSRELSAKAHQSKLLYEGDLTKVAAGGHGRYSNYRFFLFNDQLMYAQKATFGSKFLVHQKIPLNNMRVVADPPELTEQSIKHGFRIDTDIKPLFVFAQNDTEAVAWRRHIREAVAALYAVEEASSSAPSRRLSVVNPPAPGMQPKASLSAQTASSMSATGSTAPISPTSARTPVVSKASDGSTVQSARSSTESVVITSPSRPVSGSMQPIRVTSAVAAQILGTGSANSAAVEAVQKRASATLAPLVIRHSAADLEDLNSLKKIFLSAVAFTRPLLSSEMTTGTSSAPEARTSATPATQLPAASMRLTDQEKLAFYALFKQATVGDCPEAASSESAISGTVDPQQKVMRTKMDAWARKRGIRRRDAMREFVSLLDEKIPSWQ